MRKRQKSVKNGEQNKTSEADYKPRYVRTSSRMEKKTSAIKTTMNLIELRQAIIRMVSAIDDESYLLAIRTILESKANESVYKLSRYQIREIRESRRQVQSGQTISNEDLQKEVRKWLRTN